MCYKVLPLPHSPPEPVGAVVLPVLNCRMCLVYKLQETITSHLNSSSSALRSNSSTSC